MRIFNFQFLIPERRKGGQVMLITVLVLSAVFLSVTVIAGTLMTYQIHQVTRVVDSTQAVFAADAAIERALFNVFRCNATTTPTGYPGGWNDPSNPDVSVLCPIAGNQSIGPAFDCLSVAPPGTPPAFCNGATYDMLIEANGILGVHDSSASSTQVDRIKATGRAGKTARAFELKFKGI